MSRTIHTFDYLRAPEKYPPAAVSVVFGDEAFLKQLAVRQLRTNVLEDHDAPFATFAGETVEWRDVADELSTVALFGGGGRRLAIVEDADAFVRDNRARLEDYVEKPKSNSVLVLDVTNWQSNTRLYKAIDQNGLQIECRAPQKAIGKRKVLDEGRMVKWLSSWSRQRHDAKLQRVAGELLLELVGPEFGLLDQELAKLALFAEPGGEITPEMVRDVVGGWRTQTIWELMDAACDGNAADALGQLDRLLQSGEQPVALFGQISWSLRRFAAATRIYQQAERVGRKPSVRQALEQAGFRKWPKEAMERAERQLRQLGRERAARLYRWLLEADLALKGSHSAPQRARLVLERLLVRMAKHFSPAARSRAV
jgi:DNA polymerase-3 subunit delta